jgi:hypothetical protein
MPTAVDVPTVTVRVEFPEPGDAIDAGLNAAVTPVGKPDAVSATADLKLPEIAVVMVLVPFAPGATVSNGVAAEIVNVAGAVIFRITKDVCVTPPPVAVTVTGYEPITAVEATVKVSVDEPEPGAAMDAGLNAAVTPAGSPLAVSVIAEFRPPETTVVIVDVPLLPCGTETEAGETDSVKSEGVGVPVSASIRPMPLGLPQPVTRS